MKRLLLPASFLVVFASCQAYYIPTGSMEKSLMLGDHIMVWRLPFTLKRGDIVIFRPPLDDDKDYIKRVVALPGDRVAVRDGALLLNSRRLAESYAMGLTTAPWPAAALSPDGVVPAGKCVVLGDNRENSMDSRHFGYVGIDRIKGLALVVYLNFMAPGRIGVRL